jgi:hypothetical protein
MPFKIANPFREHASLRFYDTSCAFPFILIWPLLNCAFRLAIKGLLPSAALVTAIFWLWYPEGWQHASTFWDACIPLGYAIFAAVDFRDALRPWRILWMILQSYFGLFGRLCGRYSADHTSRSMRLAQFRATRWFQRRFAGDDLPDAFGVAYGASGLLCGAYILSVAVFYFGIGFGWLSVPSHAALRDLIFYPGLGFPILFGLFFLVSGRLSRDTRQPAPQVPPCPRQSLWPFAQSAFATLMILSYVLGIYGLPGLFAVHPNPHWYVIEALLLLYLWSWWAIFVVWLFGDPRSGYFPCGCHWPSLIAARVSPRTPKHHTVLRP